MVEINKHSHEILRGHISPDHFDAAIREDWRSTRYWEALQCHHTYSNDRPGLLAVVHNLLVRLEKQLRFLHAADNGSMSILDVGCGTGEVSSAILAKLDAYTRLEYIGIDKNPQVLEAARRRLKKIADSKVQISLHQKNYTKKKWNRSIVLKKRRFNIVWLIHSGYYVERNHGDFLESLEQFATSHGLMILIHNPEGNVPFLTAAGEMGLKAYRIQYERQICPPKLPGEVFDTLSSENPRNIDEFSQLFTEYPEARSLRLMLEFYLPEYPLEFLSPHDRCCYIKNWEDHLHNNNWKFVNDHEMLVLLPRHHDILFQESLEAVLKEGFTNERGTNIFRHHC